MPFFRSWRRRRLMARPAPAHWGRILQENVALYGRLRPRHRRKLEGLMRVFMAEKDFEGCGGLRLTDPVRVTVAGQACLLLLGRDMDFWPSLRTVLVYPTGYWARDVESPAHGIVTERDAGRLGEARPGSVVLSWGDARAGAAREDGVNLVFHEFAHVVDFHFGLTESLLERLPDDLDPWQRGLREQFEDFADAAERGGKLFMDAYGAENPAEFFAVATERFMERPDDLYDAKPALYRLLRTVYRLDPIRELADPSV